MNTRARNILDRPDLARAAELFAEACEQSREHSRAAAAALEAYGDNGPQISGCIRDHFPQCTKDYLRSLARNVSIYLDAAHKARPPRFRVNTMRKLAQAIARRDGCGFYGPQA